MKIVICATEAGFAAISGSAQNVDWVRVNAPVNFAAIPDAAVYINLLPNAAEGNYEGLQQPVFINSLANTLLASEHIIRINGWNGFIEKDQWEIAGNVTPTVTTVLNAIG